MSKRMLSRHVDDSCVHYRRICGEFSSTLGCFFLHETITSPFSFLYFLFRIKGRCTCGGIAKEIKYINAVSD